MAGQRAVPELSNKNIQSRVRIRLDKKPLKAKLSLKAILEH